MFLGSIYILVAQISNISQLSEGRVLKRYRETETFSRRPVQGCPRTTTAIQHRFWRLLSLRNRTTTARNLQNPHQVSISHRTVRNKLREHELLPKRAATGP